MTRPKPRKMTNKVIALEIERLTGHKYDPAYIANIRNGNRGSNVLAPIIEQAERNLRRTAA